MLSAKTTIPTGIRAGLVALVLSVGLAATQAFSATTPVIAWANPGDIVYGTALGAAELNATASDPDTLANVPGTWTYNPLAGTVLSAGLAQNLHVDFVPDDPVTYNNASADAVINVLQATPVITWANPPDIPYGTVLGGAQLNATASTGGTFTYTPAAGTVVSALGPTPLHVDFVPDDAVNYTNANKDVSVNVIQATPVITWATPVDIVYGTALDGTQLNATASTAGTFTYTPGATTVLEVGNGQTLHVDFVPDDAVNYTNANKDVTINVLKIPTVITWATPSDIVYGTALTTSELNATASVPGTLTYTPPEGTVLNAGARTLHVDFVPDDTAHYANAGKDVTINVTQITSTITWANPLDIVYGTALDGTQLNATASVPGDFVYTPASGTVLNAGPAQTLSVAFTPTDTVNYTNANASVLINVTQIASTTVVTTSGTPSTYGVSVTFTATVSGAYGTPTTSVQFVIDGGNAGGPAPLIGGVATYATAALVVGNHTVDATYAGDGNFLGGSGSLTDGQTVNQATPVITWENPLDIVYGTALDGTQLNATADVPGDFVYTPPATTVLEVGPAQTLSVAFTPTDTVNYTNANKSVTINVLKITPVITWSNPADIVYGTALSTTELNATASDAGTLTYTPPEGTVLNAGARTLHVDFVPDDTAHCANASKDVTINVLQITTTITWNNPDDIVYGTALDATQLNATASVPGTLTYTPAEGAVLNAGARTLHVDFVPADTNYANASKDVAINVLQAASVITWVPPADIPYGTVLGPVELNATANVAGTMTYTPPAGTVVLALGPISLHVDVVPIDTVNYTNASKDVTANVIQATPVITWANPANIVYLTALDGTQLNATANTAGTFTYTPLAGTVLEVGNGQTLHVDFVPDDAVNYTNASKDVTINVLKITPTITWTNPADIAYGTALSGTELNATASVEGTFVYTPAAGTVMNFGNSQTLSVAFTPTDTAHYSDTSASVLINVRGTWVDADIGAPAYAGSAVWVAGGGTNGTDKVTIKGGGADIWGNADAFNFCYMGGMRGDCQITARVSNWLNPNGDGWSKVGVMARQSTAAGSIYVASLCSWGNAVHGQWRDVLNGVSGNTGNFGASGANWVRLTRYASNNAFTLQYSTDGATWSTNSTYMLVMSDPIELGLCVTTHNNGVANLTSADFDNISIVQTTATNSGVIPCSVTVSDWPASAPIYYTNNGTAPTTGSTLYSGPLSVSTATQIRAVASTPGSLYSAVVYSEYRPTLPSPWVDTDIGGAALGMPVLGTATVAAGGGLNGSDLITINGAGGDIWNNQDRCNFMYQPINGNFTMKVRVVSQQNTGGWAKAGLMVRANLSPGSPDVYNVTTPGNSISLQWRDGRDGGCGNAAGVGNSTKPYWLQLERIGTLMIRSISTDGVNWTSYTTHTSGNIGGNPVYAGFCVNSVSDTLTSTAVFDSYNLITQVTATPVIAGTNNNMTPSTVTLTCTTPGSSIYYTLDGSWPSETNGTLYMGTFVVNTAWTTVNAVGVAPGYGNSNRASTFFDTLRTPEYPVTPVGLVQGVCRRFYSVNGSGGGLPNFNNITLTSTQIDPDCHIPGSNTTTTGQTVVAAGDKCCYDYATNANPALNYPYVPITTNQSGMPTHQNWSVQFTGYITVPQSGWYTLYSDSDDAAAIYIGTRLVANNGGNHLIALGAGTHKLTYQYSEGGGGWYTRLSYMGPGIGNGTTKTAVPGGSYTYGGASSTCALWTEPKPTVTGLDVAGGPTTGGTLVHITGTGFLSSSVVTFGANAATYVTVNSNTLITCKSPAGAAGAVAVTVTNINGAAGSLANAFTYKDWTGKSVPIVNSLDLTGGPLAGGTLISISGSGFAAPAAVYFGNNACSYVIVNSNTLIQCKSPAGAALGTVDVTVQDLYGTDGASGTLANAFTYQDWAGQLIPTVTSLSVHGGPVEGGTLVNITGTNFAAGGTVRINFGIGIATDYITVASDTLIQCKSPPGPAGTVDVTVTNIYGTSGASGTPATGFTYVDWGTNLRPSLANATLNPNSGDQRGGYDVTITGESFYTGGASVYFGLNAATNVRINSETEIVCTAPPGNNPVLVDVTVTNLYSDQGASDTTGSAFDYLPAPPPTLTSIEPTHGVGGTLITLIGDCFLPGSSVLIGGVAPTAVTYVDTNHVTCRVPSMSTSVTVDVTITTSTPPSATLTGAFTYDTPSISGVSPDTGWSYGGTQVQISGAAFDPGVAVTFAGVAATGVSVNANNTVITATTPAHLGGGSVTVVATNPGGLTGSKDNAFTYVGPIVTTVTPNTGAYNASTTVTIAGSNFASTGVTVTVGGQAATVVSVSPDHTAITAAVPAMAATATSATANVVVTNPDGLSTTKTGGFTYTGLWPADLASTAGMVPGVFRTYYGASSSGQHSGALPINANLSALWTPYTGADPGNPTITANCTVIQNGQNPYHPADGDGWCLQFAGYISVPNDGLYTFGTNVDDNAIIYIGTTRVATNNPGGQGQGAGQLDNAALIGTAPLMAGLHRITVQFEEGGGGWGLVAAYCGVSVTGATPYYTNAGRTWYSIPGNVLWTQTICTITSVVPIGGPQGGGGTAIVHGSGFSPGATVKFGANLATGVAVNSNSMITCTVPSGTVGTTVGVTVTNLNYANSTLANAYTYVDWTGNPTPSVAAVSPNTGSQAGGTPVTVTGSGFGGDSVAVLFGGYPADPASIIVAPDGLSLTCVTPATSYIGLVSVTVTDIVSGMGASSTLPDAFTFTVSPAPTVTGISPDNGTYAGGTAVTITGTNLIPGSTVTFGGVASPGVTVNFNQTITAITPAINPLAPSNAVSVVVNSNNGTTPATSPTPFTYTGLRPPDLPSTAGLMNGVYRQYYEYGGLLPPTYDLNTVWTPFGGSTSAVDYNCEIIYAAANNGNPYRTNQGHNDNWGVQFSGWITVPQTGVYSFGTDSDDGSMMYIGTQLVADNNYWQGWANNGVPQAWSVRTIGLMAGVHKFTSQFYEGGGGWGQHVYFMGPGIPAWTLIPHSNLWTQAAPVVSSLDVTGGPTGGGTLVHITGQYFAAGDAVTFGTASVPNPPTDVLAHYALDGNALDSSGNNLNGTENGGPTYVAGQFGQAISLNGSQYVSVPYDAAFALNTFTVSAWVNVNTRPTNFAILGTRLGGPDNTFDLKLQNGLVHCDIGNGAGWLHTDADIFVEMPFGEWHMITYVVDNAAQQTTMYFDGAFKGSQGLGGTPLFMQAGQTLGIGQDFAGEYMTGQIDDVRIYARALSAAEVSAMRSVHTGVAATGVLVNSPTMITCISPPGAPGVVDVTVTNTPTNQASGTLTGAFTYVDWTGLPVPTVISVVDQVTGDNTGAPEGGEAALITGNFTTDPTFTTLVYFGGNAATDVVVAPDGLSLTCVTPPGIGRVDVSVTLVDASGNGASGTLPLGFNFMAVPSVASISPDHGSALGSTLITITGQKFAFSGLTVTIGGNLATNVVVSPDNTTITANTPPMTGTDPVKDVVVTNPGGLSTTVTGGYTYDLNAPVTALATQAGLSFKYYRDNNVANFATATPFLAGPIANPNFSVGVCPWVPTDILFGVEFVGYVNIPNNGLWTFTTGADDGSQLYVDGQLIVPMNWWQNPGTTTGKIGLVAGLHTIKCQYSNNGGWIRNEVQCGNDVYGPLADNNQFYFVDAMPAVTSIVPDIGPMAGGTAVQINGASFRTPLTLTFNGVAASNIAVNGNNTITANTPAGAYGPADVLISEPGLGSTLVVPGGFYYQGVAPTIAGISPNTSGTAGGIQVTISGTNLNAGNGRYPGPRITIGGQACTNVVWISSTAVTATAPAGAAGICNVVVTNIDNQSATLVNGYTYTAPSVVTEPGWQYRYWRNGNLPNFAAPGAPWAAGVQADNVIGGAGLDPNVIDPTYGTNDNFSVYYLGYIDVDLPGEYAFSLNSDDATQLYINSNLVVNDTSWGVTRNGTIQLEANRQYPIAALWQQGGGGWYLNQIQYQKLTAPDPAAIQGLVAHWPFEGNLNDTSGNGHDGTGSNNPGYARGWFGQGLSLNGSQDVSVPYSDALALNSFTVSAWVSTNADPGTFGILGTRFGGENTFDLKVQGSIIHADLGDGANWLNTNLDFNTPAGDPGAGGRWTTHQWHMVTYAVDNDTTPGSPVVTMYLDGVLMNTANLTGTPLLMKPGQTMGIGNASPGEYMNGIVDDVCIYSRALSDPEIATLYGTTAPVNIQDGHVTITREVPPTVDSVTPNSGGVNAAVTILGTGFVPGTNVAFGGIWANTVTYVSPTTLIASTPGGPAGLVNVVVVKPSGSAGMLANGFTFALRAPDLADATGLVNGTSYKYYRMPAPYANNVNYIPFNPNVGGAGSGNPDALEGFTPQSTGILRPGTGLFDNAQPICWGPSQWMNTGGNNRGNLMSPLGTDNTDWFWFRETAYFQALVDGTYEFGSSSDDGTLVFIGNTLVVNNNNGQGTTDRTGTIGLAAGLHLITMLYSEGNGGYSWSVWGTPPGGTRAYLPDAQLWVADPAPASPTIISVSPNFGPVGGGTNITITGTNFVQGNSVSIGGIAAKGVTVNSNTTITCVTPPAATGTFGPQDVMVTNVFAAASGKLLGGFTYVLPATHLDVSTSPSTIGAGDMLDVTVTAKGPGGGDVSGFGGAWQLNGGTTINGNGGILLTDSNNNEARSAFFSRRVGVDLGFNASFVYQAGGNRAADGAAFVLQEAGPVALGGNGGSLGYNGIAGNSVALEFNIYTGGGQPAGINLGINGSTGTYVATGSVNVASGDPILVQVAYDSVAQTVGVTLTDQTTSATYSTTINGVSLPSLLGANTAYVGFTAGTGGANAIQTINNFSFAAPVPEYVDAGYSGTVHFTSTDLGSLVELPADYAFVPGQAGDNGSHTFNNVRLVTVGTQYITATDVADSIITGTSPEITVNGTDKAASFVVNCFPLPFTAGIPGSISVTANDIYGNVASLYTGTVKFETSDQGSAVMLPNNTPFAPVDEGILTIADGVTLVTAGAQSVTVTDVNNSLVTGKQEGIPVVAGAPDHLAVSGFPSPVVSAKLSSFTVEAQDAYGNRVTDYFSNGPVYIFSDDPLFTAFEYTFTGTEGGVVGLDATLLTLGTWSLFAQDASIGGQQDNIVVIPKFGVTHAPPTFTAGIEGTITVRVEDWTGAPIAGYSGTVAITTNDDAHAILPPNAPITATGDFALTMTKVWPWPNTVTATDVDYPDIKGSGDLPMQNAPASKLYVFGFPSPIPAGTAGDVTVWAQDPFDNVATEYAGEIHFTSSDNLAVGNVLPADYTFDPLLDAGMHTFAVADGCGATLVVPGPLGWIKAEDTVIATIAGTQVDIDVQITPTITWANPDPIVYGTALDATQLNATASDPITLANVPGTMTYTPAAGTILNAGDGQVLHVDFVPTDQVTYANTSKDVTINVTKAPATVTLDVASLSQVYDGTAKTATVTTVPPGLVVDFTYDGLPDAPINVGSYAVVATVNEANWQGSASGTLEITKGTATVQLADLTQVYDGTPKSATATTVPPGLVVDITYDGLPDAPIVVGSYAVVATVNDANWQGSANGTLEITKGTATVQLADLTQVYDGTAKSATVTTVPSPLVVDITYDGLPDAPINVGSYAVVATVNDANYQGSANGTLEITKATATVTLDVASLSQVYDGTAKTVTVTTDPPGLLVDITYTPTPPINVGNYDVVATVNDANYQGTASGTLEITKATATVTLDVASLNQVYDGTAKTVTATTVPPGLLVDITYTPTPPIDVGSYDVLATVNDANWQGSASGTLEIVPAAPVLVSAQWIHGSGAGGVSEGDQVTLTFDVAVTLTSGSLDPAAVFGLPVTQDSFGAGATLSSTGDPKVLAITLGSNPKLTPGGMYDHGQLADGKPSGVFVLDGTNIVDSNGHAATVQTIDTAVDVAPGEVHVSICWNDLNSTIAPREWNLQSTGLGVIHQASTYLPFAPPNGLDVRNNGNVRETFTAQCSGASPAGWAIGPLAALNTFEMKVDNGGGGYTIDLAGGVQDIANKVYSGGNKVFDLQLKTPTAIDSGAGTTQTIAVTITATQD